MAKKQKQKYVKVDLRKEKTVKYSASSGSTSTIDKGVWASNRDRYLKKTENQPEKNKGNIYKQY